jgi:SAM-dependent methyltransferase
MSSSGTDDREPVAADEPDAAIGFTRVDAQPDTATLIEGMDATAQWPAVKQLRAWEVARLGLRPGRSLLDVGCGVGSVATALAPLVAPGGTVAAVDPSEAMLAEGRRRAEAARVSVDFRAGLAEDLPFDDATFDVCRSERALQWMPDPEAALDEMLRTTRPGGRLVVIDTDWRTLAFDLPDEGPGIAVAEGIRGLRGRPASIGGRLLNLFRDRGLADLDIIGAAHVWHRWRPDVEEAPPGLFPLRAIAMQLVALGRIEQEVGEQFSDQVTEAARRDRLSISLTMFAVHGRKPA